MLPLKMTINRIIFNCFLMAFLMGAINGILMGLYAVVMPKNVLISLREFCRHIPSLSTTQAAWNKGCLHSLSWGVSLKQHVTCVTISNKENVV